MLRALLFRYPAWVLLLLGLPVFLGNYLGGGRVGISGWDPNYYFSYAAALADGGTLDLERAFTEMVRHGADPVAFSPERRTATGQVYNYFPLGHGVLHAPAVFLGKYVAMLTEGRPNAFGPTAQGFFCLSCMLAAAFGLHLIHRRVCALLEDDGEAAAVALLALAAASMLGYYWFLVPALSHTSSLLVVGLLWTLLDRLRAAPQEGALPWYFALGALTGLGVIVRLQDVALGCLLLLGLVRVARSAGPASARVVRVAAGVLGGAAVSFAQMLHWRWKDGTWIVREYNDYSHFQWSDPHFVEVLFSPRHGLFLWHPVLLGGFVGFCLWLRSPRADRGLGAAWLGLFAGLWAIGAFYSIWWFGDSFGSRPFLTALPLFWIGLAWLWKEHPRRRGVLAAIGVLLAMANAVLALAFHFAWISRSGPLF